MYPARLAAREAGVEVLRVEQAKPDQRALIPARGGTVRSAALRRTGPLKWKDRGKGLQKLGQPTFGDIVLTRKDTPASYHLAVVIDDVEQGVTLVTRGMDLFGASAIHRLLQELLELPVPEWHHHKLLTDEQGVRLAKRDKARSTRHLRASGLSPEEVRKMAGIED